jgi:2-octaprenyl-6-methoxyphenol hydroxylase
MSEARADRCDVLVIGGGPVGMTLARSLAESALSVLVVDRAPRGAWKSDPRALAIAHGSRQLLERLGAWESRAATEICEIHVSQRGGFGRTLIRASDYDVPALGYAVRYRDLAGALDRGLADRAEVVQGEVDGIKVSDEDVRASVTTGGAVREIEARLVVHAEGAPPAASDASGARGVTMRDYRQQAIIAEVTPAQAHGHRAWERFTADGPFALLPLDDHYGMVFTASTERAATLMALDDAGFLEALRAQFGTRVDFVAVGARTSIPLALRLRPKIATRREAWIGNTAQTLHPVSGQGLNLGLRDACELAQAILDKGRLDAGDASVLESYARGRRIDRIGSAVFTDGVVRVFSNDFAPLKAARGLGLLALDLYPPLRHFVAKRMLWGARAWP